MLFSQYGNIRTMIFLQIKYCQNLLIENIRCHVIWFIIFI